MERIVRFDLNSRLLVKCRWLRISVSRPKPISAYSTVRETKV
jgi:hypothetical protein